MPAMRIRCVRCRTDDQQEQDLAQALLRLRRLQEVFGFDQPERRTRQGHLLPRLLQQELWNQGSRLRHWRRSSDNGLRRGVSS